MDRNDIPTWDDIKEARWQDQVQAVAWFLVLMVALSLGLLVVLFILAHFVMVK